MDVPDCVHRWVCTELIVLVLVDSVNGWWSTLTVIFDLVWMGLRADGPACGWAGVRMGLRADGPACE